jgi:transcriptional regulator with XRE-family HTH domain
MSSNVNKSNNSEPKINSELFDKARLQKGLSRMGLALEAEVAPQTVNRLLQGKPTRPSNVKKVGEALGVPAQDWYIKERSQ